jgi:hypothetical protein
MGGQVCYEKQIDLFLEVYNNHAAFSTEWQFTWRSLEIGGVTERCRSVKRSDSRSAGKLEAGCFVR